MPTPVFVIDRDGRLVDFNKAGSALLGDDPPLMLRRKGGEALHCIHSTRTPGGCGTTPACQDCVVRNSVGEAFSGGTICRKLTRMQFLANETVVNASLLVTTSPFDFDGERLVLLVLEDVSELTALRNIIPICSGCRKVRVDEEYWQNVDSYLKRHLDLEFSHGICPDCMTRLYPEFAGREEW